MKYKLISKSTKEEHICEKVTIDGMDYYVSNEKPQKGNWYLKNNIMLTKSHIIDDTCKKVIATNNPNSDIPKVVYPQILISNEIINNLKLSYTDKELQILQLGISKGYNKSQETHPFSEEDMVQLIKWMQKPSVKNGIIDSDTILFDEEIFQIWKEQQPKIIYYND